MHSGQRNTENNLKYCGSIELWFLKTPLESWTQFGGSGKAPQNHSILSCLWSKVVSPPPLRKALHWKTEVLGSTNGLSLIN